MRPGSVRSGGLDARRPLRSVLVLCVTLALVTAPVAAAVSPTGTPGETDTLLDPTPVAGNEGLATAGNDGDGGLATAGNDGTVPPGTVTPDPNQSVPTPPTTDGPPDASDSLSGPANVTLVTGTTVTVVPTPNGTEYHVRGNASAETVHTDRGTYVFPRDADLSTFDRALFNVDLLVAQHLTDAEAGSIPVIVTRPDGRSETDGGVGTQRVVSAPADVEGVTVGTTLPAIDAVAGHVEKPPATAGATSPAAAGTTGTDDVSPAASLASSDAVGRVHLDRRVRVHLDDAANVTRTYRARQQFDVSGEGVRVAVLDTGIDTTHPDLDDAVVASKDFTGEGLADDPNGHGTHVAGIVAGDGTASDGAYRGFAPDASLLNARVLGSDGYGRTSDIVAAMEWATEQNADVVSMSLGGSPTGPADLLTAAVDNATDNGVTVVTSAGNDGPSARTIGSPGIAESAITVGATDDADVVAGFSSRGPTPYADRVKPDLVAPGVRINSTCSANGEDTCRGADGAGYTTLSGTSMAAPAVSGVAALLEAQEATDGDDDADLSPGETKTRLVTSADRLPGYTVYQTGSGRLNATRALDSELRLSAGTVSVGSVAGTNRTVDVTVTNTGTDDILLPVTLAVTNQTGDAQPTAAQVRNVGGESLRLAPGESQTVTVEVNASVRPDNYSARLLFGDDGNPAHQRRTVSLGWQAGIATLTVEKLAASGDQSDVRDDVIEVFGQTTSVTERQPTTARGTATFELPVGNYTVASPGTTEGTGEPTVVVDAVSLTSDRRVTLDEGETVRYRLDDANLAADRVDALGSSVAVEHADSPTVATVARSRQGTTSVRVSEGAAHRTSVGFLAVPKDEYDYTERDLGEGEAYSLAFYTAGVDGPETFAPSESSLSTLDVTTYRTHPTGSYQLTTGGFATSDARYRALAGDLGAARTVTLRVNTDAGHAYGTGFVDDSTDSLFGYALSSGESVDPATTDGVTLNRRPFTGLLDWRFADAPDRLHASGVALADQGRPRNTVFAVPGRVTLTEGGTLVAARPLDFSGALDVNRTATPGETYRLRVQVNRTFGDTDPRATMVAAGTNHGDADGTPPRVDRIEVPALGLNGGVPREELTLDLTLSDAGDPVSGVADVQVRYAPGDVATPAWENGAPTDPWTTATVTETDGPTRQTATLDLRNVPADRVSVAVRVTDGNGNVVVHHSYDSLAVGRYTGDTAPPTPRLSGRIENASGVPSTNDSVLYFANGSGSRLEAVVTDETGQFEATPENGTVELTYLQTNYPATTPRDSAGDVDRRGRFWTKRFARDGTPDLYSLGAHEVDGPTDLADTVTLPEAGTLNVSVTDESGTPVEDAAVVVRHHAPDDSATASWRNDTNADGLFQNYMTARPGVELHGDVTITVSPPDGAGYVDRRYTRKLTMDAADRQIDVTLVENSSVTGRVETPDGSASTDDSLFLWDAAADVSAVERTDDAGRFETQVPPGSYETVLLQRSAGGLPAPRDGVVDVYSFGRVDASDDVALGTQTLPTGHTLSVTVVDAWGEPLPTADVVVSHDREDVTAGVTFDTDERGRIVPHEGGPPGVEVPESVTVSAVTGSDGTVDTTRSLTVVEDRTARLAVPGTVDNPLTVRATPSETTAGDPVRVTLTRSRDGAPVDGTVTVNGTTHRTGADGAVTVTLDRPGNYSVDGRTELATGRAVTDSASVAVVADEGGDGGGGGGGGGGTPIPPAGIVDVRETDAGAFVTAEKVKGGRLIRNLLPGVASDHLTVEQFSFTLRDDDRRFTAAFAASDEVPTAGSAPAMAGALGYLRVETDGLPDATLQTARFRFEVARAALDGLGASPDDVRLYRYHDGEWRAVETRHAGGTTFVGVTPGFSTFAVGVQSSASDAGTATATPSGSAQSQATTPNATATPTVAGDPSATTETTGPGFGPGVALAALLAVALLALSARRRD